MPETTMPDTLTAYREEFVMDDDHPAGLYAFACSICDRDVSTEPCPDHAPSEVPGLRLPDYCNATPRHRVWTLDRDDYGVDCPYCALERYYEKDRLARQCRHWSWRRWKLTHKVAGRLYVLGIAATGGGWSHGDGCEGCMPDRSLKLRGKRVYILGVDRNVWRCWLKGRHRRGEEVGFGFCGKCMPWLCCGSEREDHATGCPEAEVSVSADA